MKSRGWGGKRLLGERRYKRLFLIATEGAVTEPQYFKAFNSEVAVVKINCLPPRSGTSPDRVLARMVDALKTEHLQKADQAWLVIDRDNWPEDQLAACVDWVNARSGRGLALSNPNFELWLLLHVHEIEGHIGLDQINSRMRQCFPGYDKYLTRPFSDEEITNACNRAARRNNPPTRTWPQHTGSTVYLLVQAIREAKSI